MTSFRDGRRMSLLQKIKRAIRGEVSPQTVVREVVRRSRGSLQQQRERASLARAAQETARLHPNFAHMPAADLVAHFQQRTRPNFFSGFARPTSEVAPMQRLLFPEETDELISTAERITTDHCWPLLGLMETCFGNPIDWHRDPLSQFTWPLDYYADIDLQRGDGSDVRFVWEQNRLGHFLTLARAYAITSERRYSDEFYQQVESWHASNPLGLGVNWNCAMEVALRAMNLLGAFTVFRCDSEFDEQKLFSLLTLLDQHGRFVHSHLEFSHIATSNHYLSNVVGLLWLGVMLPELEQAETWRTFGLGEMLSEMDKQVLDDGADFESSTGYHRFVLELFLYSFLLCRANEIEIDSHHWDKLHRMLRYVCAYLRPGGDALLIGDSDGGQVFPLRHHRGDDHAYLLALGAAVFNDSQLKVADVSPELLWILGAQGIEAHSKLAPEEVAQGSQSFPNAGIYIFRDRDLYLLFNASDSGLNGRGSHGHNDALSIDVSACGRPFIVDPGTYVYTADSSQRHLFRSTAYHSTVEVDYTEQNTTSEEMPFVIGDEARPRVLEFDLGPSLEALTAEHYGYRRLPQPVVHQRRVVFDKEKRYWFLSDKLTGVGEHSLAFRFHFAPGLQTTVRPDGIVEAIDTTSDARLLIAAYELNEIQARRPELEARFSSSDYGTKKPSMSACWSVRTGLPFELNFVIVPICAGEDETERLNSVLSFED